MIYTKKALTESTIKILKPKLNSLNLAREIMEFQCLTWSIIEQAITMVIS